MGDALLVWDSVVEGEWGGSVRGRGTRIEGRVRLKPRWGSWVLSVACIVVDTSHCCRVFCWEPSICLRASSRDPWGPHLCACSYSSKANSLQVLAFGPTEAFTLSRLGLALTAQTI